METLPAIALLLGGLGSILAVYATIRGQQTNVSESKLAMAWDMQEKHLNAITKENEDHRERLRTCEAELLTVRKELSDCREGRRQLEIQVELLKLGRKDG